MDCVLWIDIAQNMYLLILILIIDCFYKLWNIIIKAGIIVEYIYLIFVYFVSDEYYPTKAKVKIK